MTENQFLKLECPVMVWSMEKPTYSISALEKYEGKTIALQEIRQFDVT